MFSVIIPLYNKEKSIGKTIATVLNQEFTDFELLVVNDGSTDASLSVVEAIKDSRIKIINKVNGGVSSARNLGIDEAKYSWVALLDGDDIWDKNHLSNIYNIIDKEDINCVCTGFVLARSNGDIIKKYQVEKEGLYDYFELSITMGFPVHSSAICIDKHTIGDLRFNENLTIGEDNEFWEKLGRITAIYFIKDVSSRYIDDSENKAIRKKHNLDKTHVYNVVLDPKLPEKEVTYYKKLIIYNILLSFKNYNFANGVKLYSKYSKSLSIRDFYEFIGEVFRK